MYPLLGPYADLLPTFHPLDVPGINWHVYTWSMIPSVGTYPLPNENFG